MTINKTLYYVHDPMCSWCWGFRPVWNKIQKKLPKDLEVKYLLGGLAADTNEIMPKAMQLQIRSYWKKIQEHIPNTDFNYDFWSDCKPRRSTYPACRAVIAAKAQNPKLEKDMIKAIQTAYYLQAKNPSDDLTLIHIAASLNLDQATFTKDLHSKETQKKLESEIFMCNEIGAQGFPSMILKDGNNFYRVPLDYNDEKVPLSFILDR